MPHSPLHQPILDWYDANARDLPWRRPGCAAWGVLVSEIMLQQTQVARVEPVWSAWLARWPNAAALAASSPGEAVRAWGRLGYPRRALRLHEAANMIVERYDGEVPASYAALRALPGVGDYTAAAVATFAFGRRHAVLDTNVRRVLARALTGEAQAAPTPTAAERRLAESLLPEPEDPTPPGAGGGLSGHRLTGKPPARRAARWAVAVMELGALVCTAKAPACGDCPIRELCTWRLAGRPSYDGRTRPRQPFAGTDRQARGRLLAVLRAAPGAVPKSNLDAAWPHDLQRERALDGLVSDGLVEPIGKDRFQLPQRRATAAT